MSIETGRKAYLIAAYYSRSKWHRASSSALEEAEDAAEELFPEEDTPLAALTRQGVYMAHTFASDLFDKIATSYNQLQTALETSVQKTLGEQGLAASANTLTVVQQQIVASAITEIPREVRDQIVDGIFATQPPKIPVGWMVVVDAEHFASYIEKMSGAGKEKGLWSVFTIEISPLDEGWTEASVRSQVPPLREDQTTRDIYVFMTPTNWGHKRP